MNTRAITVTKGQRIVLAIALAIVVTALCAVIEAFVHTRLRSAYVPAADYSERSFFLLAGQRERGHLVEMDGKGFHSAEPGRTPQEVTEMLRKRYPYDFDEKKIVWILKDEEGAFFYRLLPNWAALALFSALLAIPLFVVLGKWQTLATKETIVSQENIRIFGKLGVADLLAIGLGASACSNIASLFTRNPLTAVYIALTAALFGAVAIRYGIVMALRYIDKTFEGNPKKVVFVRIFYFVVVVVMFFVNFATK